MAAVVSVLLVWWVLDYLIARPIPKEDVSNHVQWTSVIGKRFRTQRELEAIGYTMDRNFKKQIDYIALIEPPGFSGPEVVARARLQKGAVLEVVAVLKADTWIVNRVEYVVKRVDASAPLEGRMLLRVDHTSQRNFGLSDAVFASLNGDA